MVCGGFLTVEHMRRGMAPTDACLETLKRVVRHDAAAAASNPKVGRAFGSPSMR